MIIQSQFRDKISALFRVLKLEESEQMTILDQEKGGWIK